MGRSSLSSRGGRTGVKAGRAAQAQDNSTDALDFLKSQHREVEALFEQFERAKNDNERFELAQIICDKLTVHAQIEEEILYPAARSRGEGDEEVEDLVLEAAEEHLSAKRLIGDLGELQPADQRLKAKISVLKEQVLHHVKEEEGELFPQMKKEISKDERREMGQQLLQRAQALEAGDEGASAAGQEAIASRDEVEEDEESEPAKQTDSASVRASAGRPSRAPNHMNH